MLILVTGANGLVGQHLIKQLLLETDHTVAATGKGSCRLPVLQNKRLQYHELDITDAVNASRFYREQRPDIIIHTAAISQADECETGKVKCRDTNVTATRLLIEAAKEINARFIFLSTDFVFDGEKGSYSENELTGPVNYYGSSKLQAEKLILQSGLKAAIVRTCLVYGNAPNGGRKNMISWVKENLEQNKNIKVVNDQWRTPTYIDDLVTGILLLVEKKATGIYHISGEELMTPYDMAMATAAHLSLDSSLIEKVDASIFTQTARRPARTGFNITKAKKELGFCPISFKEALKRMLG